MSAADDAENARFAALGDFAGILPYHRRDELSALLTDADVATLKHLVAGGMGANTLRALASDLAYLERWALAATGAVLPWPAPSALAVKFVAHHLYDAIRKEADPAHGMPEEVAAALREAGTLKAAGPHAPATVKRRIALWSSMHKWRGVEGPFGDGQVRTALRLAVRAAARPRGRKSEQAVTADIVEKLLATCWMNRLIDLRDRAIILVAFGSGGRRRSEVAALRLEDIREAPDLPSPEPGGIPLPARALRLGRTKTTDAEDDAVSWLVGKPVLALDAWLARAKIEKGPVFRAIDQWDNIGQAALTPQAVNLILKKRVALAGLDPALYSAHGLRSGYLTEAARQGVPLPEAMAQSQHRSVQQAARYYNDAERKMGKAARLLG
jgi:integrase